MTVKAVVRIGNDQLISNSMFVEVNEPELPQLIENMRDTMQERQGVGIAAPQIGCNQRVIMFGFEKSLRYPNEKPVPFTILINPTIEILDDEIIEDWEGCLSIPGLRGIVPRYKKIKYAGLDPEGNTISRIAEGFHARVVQHEMDHINGVLFPQRMKDMRQFGFEEELREKMMKLSNT